MARLIYSTIASLDGYVADRSGSFDWAVPDEEVLDFLNEQERPVGTYLYGRRMYELMTVWETDPAAAAQSPGSAEFARIWSAAEKIVHSTTLDSVSTERTRLERSFDPAAVEQLKRAAPADLNVSGPGLALHAFRAGLVDEVQLTVAPVLVGGGKSCYPDDVRMDLSLEEMRRFGNGMAWLRYEVRG